MKRDDILMLEKQIDELEKESGRLEESFQKNDLKKFKESKAKILNSQKKISSILFRGA